MDIHNERREYLKAGEQVLHRVQMLNDPLQQFEQWYLNAKQADIADPSAMMLATVDSDGLPSQRTVLLKSFSSQGFVFFTNLHSKKARDLAINKHVSLIFPWLSLERQVIISGLAEPLDASENQAYFLSRPKASQIAAWTSQQSQPIESRAALLAEYSRLEQRFNHETIDLPDFWGGYCIKPTRFEFWQGGAKRLHDRFEYCQDAGDNWSIRRLQP